MALVEQLHSKDFLYKSSFIGRPLDTAGYIRLLQDIRTAMPDLEVVVEDCIGEERKVFTWSTLIGTIVRPTLGYPASDKVLSISAMGFCVQPAGPVAGACAPCSTWRAFAPSWDCRPDPSRKKRCPSQPS